MDFDHSERARAHLGPLKRFVRDRIVPNEEIPLASLGGNRDVIANCRMAIDQARLLTLKAAWALDRHGTFGALTDVSAIKVIAPNVLQMVVDAAIQIHGGEGVADPELCRLMATARALRLAATAPTRSTAR